jgi:two-component system nitrate/nitrite sensor histidine kinase NarX
LILEDLDPADTQIYLAPQPRETLVWHARRTRGGSVVAWGIGSAKLSPSPRMKGAFALPILQRHRARGLLAAELHGNSQWRGRFMLLDPERYRLGDLSFLRVLAARASLALYNDSRAWRIRSRVTATERARLVRELHDGLTQSLIGVEMEVEALRRETASSAAGEVGLGHISERLRQSIGDLRDLMVRLGPSEVTGRDVLRLVAVLADRLRRESGLDVRLISTVSDLDCTPRTCAQLAGIVQEALTNVRKHSGARSVTISFLQAEDMYRMVIEDDGRGFAFKGRLTLEQLDATERGPAVIKARVRSISGRLTIDSRPGQGARIEVEWPGMPHE